jgi:hypothetical protein
MIKSSAPITANQNTEETSVSMMLNAPASTAIRNTLPISTGKGNTVQKAAVLSIHGKEKGIQRVFDIEVEGAHEYFANGILVHNCDGLRYAVFTKLSKPRKKFLY